jgi:hypothetical protein
MCVRPLPESLRNASGGDIDRLIAALISIGADGDITKAWDLIECYAYSLDTLRDKDNERRATRVAYLTPVPQSGISGIRRTRCPPSPYALALEGGDTDAGRTFEAQSDTVEASRPWRPTVSGAS